MLADNSRIDYDTQSNAFVIINAIITNSDVVPKLLVMKYFLDVLKNDNKTKDDIKLIYGINILATFFSAAKTTRKSTDTFAGIVMKENWRDLIRNNSKKKLSAFPKGIGFSKEVYQDGKATSTSGQYLSRRLHGILAAYSMDENQQWNPNEQVFKFVMNTSGGINDEHFLINKSGKVLIKYGENGKSVMVDIPKKVKNRVSYLSNYLVIKASINSEMDNCIIDKKIEIISGHISNGEQEIFADKFSAFLFSKVKEIFADSNYPDENGLRMIGDSQVVKDLITQYFENEFVERFDLFIDSITPENFNIKAK